MDSQLHTSFIPKQSTPQKPRKAPMSFLVIIGAVVLILSLLGWGYAYLRIENAKETRDLFAEQLRESKKAFEENFLKELEDLDFKLKAANSLLDEHVALTPFLSSLENETLVAIRYNSMSIGEDEGQYLVKLNGEALSYEAIALQSDAFANNPVYQNPVFSALELKDTGRVGFSLDFILNPEAISYRKAISGNTSAPSSNTTEQ